MSGEITDEDILRVYRKVTDARSNSEAREVSEKAIRDQYEWSVFFNEVYKDDNVPSDGASGKIQWKGTNVCMDVYCECGYHSHIDGDFAYYFKCVGCGMKYAIGTVVNMIPLTDDQADYAESRHGFYVNEGRE